MPHKRFIVLLGLYIAAVLITSANIPVMEGTVDEQYHLSYALLLQEYRQLPARFTESGALTEVAQPPLTYWIVASLLDVLHFQPYQGDPLKNTLDVRNSWSVLTDWPRRTDNYNYFVHGTDERAFHHPDIVYASRVARFVSLLWGIIAIIGAYGAAREFFSDERWALTATAIFAFTPTMIYIASIFTNDTSATALSTLIIWQTLRLVRRGASFKQMLILGVLAGLAALAKISTLLLVSGIVLALLMQWYLKKVTFQRLMLYGVTLAIPIALIFGPWVIWGWITYQDPLGLKAFDLWIKVGTFPPPTLAQVLSTLPSDYLSYWAKLDTHLAWINPLSYILFTSLIILSLAGYFSYWRSHPTIRLSNVKVQQGSLLGLLIALITILFFYWLRDQFIVAFAITGRLVYPVHIAIVILLTAGLYLLMRHRKTVTTWLFRVFVTGAMLSCVIVTPVAVHAVYQLPQMLTPEQLPKLLGHPIDFDSTVRFLGFAVDSLHIEQNTLYPIQLCWQILKPADHDMAYVVRIYDDTRTNALGERYTIPGSGKFPSIEWTPGNIFCDTLDINIVGTTHPAQIYDIYVMMLNQRTYENEPAVVDGTPVKYTAVGQVISPAGDMGEDAQINWQTVNVKFGDFADLVGIHFSEPPAPGKTVQLDVLWHVEKPTLNNWSQFIHLVGANTSLPLADNLPLNRAYPTWAWSAGENIIDHWQLSIPEKLDKGTYQIQLGFYDQATGIRVPALLDSQAVPDSSPTILSFQVP